MSQDSNHPATDIAPSSQLGAPTTAMPETGKTYAVENEGMTQSAGSPSGTKVPFKEQVIGKAD